MDEINMTTIKDHDLLVRLDEKVDNLAKILESLIKSLDQRGQAIDELKTHQLLHEKETEAMWKRIDGLSLKVDSLEFTSKTNEKSIETVKSASIILWVQAHPKLAAGVFIFMLLTVDLHDIILPYIFSLFGYKIP